MVACSPDGSKPGNASWDGTQIASASFDRLAKVWDVGTREEIASLDGNTGNVFGVSFSHDGNDLVTAGADGTIRTYALQVDDLVKLGGRRKGLAHTGFLSGSAALAGLVGARRFIRQGVPDAGQFAVAGDRLKEGLFQDAIADARRALLQFLPGRSQYL